MEKDFKVEEIRSHVKNYGRAKRDNPNYRWSAAFKDYFDHVPFLLKRIEELEAELEECQDHDYRTMTFPIPE